MTGQSIPIPVLAGMATILGSATLIGQALRWRVNTDTGQAVVANLNARIGAWWLMASLFAAALMLGRGLTIAFFGVASFLALREFLTLAPTRMGDRMTLFLGFFVIIPLQYGLIGIGAYGVFAVLIPVYALVALPAMAALAGETHDFTARAARLQFGLLLTVYALSNAPALLMLRLDGRPGQSPATLLLFLIVVVQISDVAQYVVGKLIGRTPVAPVVSPSKTVEGLIGGLAIATACGTALSGLTPFSPVVAAAMSLMIGVAGFLGGLALSAMKRDLGVKDWGRTIAGHGGVLDRMDSVCFAAPLFFHVTRYFYA